MVAKRLLIIVAVTGLLGLITLLFLREQDKPRIGYNTLYQSNMVGRNIQFPAPTEKGEIRFFTGTAFAQLNTRTGRSQSLSREFILSSVEEVKWSADEALIRVPRVEDMTEMSEAIDRYPALSREPSWWRINIKKGTLAPVTGPAGDPTRVVNAGWQNQNPDAQGVLLVIERQANGTFVLSGGKTPIPLQQANERTKLVGQVQDGYIYRTDGHLMLVDEKGSSRTLTDELLPYTEPRLSRDLTTIVYSETAPEKEEKANDLDFLDEGKILRHEIATGKRDTISNEALQGFAISGPYTIFAANKAADEVTDEKQDKIYFSYYEENKGRSADLDLKLNTDRLATVRAILPLRVSDTEALMLVTDNTDNAYLLSSDESIQETIAPRPLVIFEESRFPLATIPVVYDLGTNSLEAEIHNEDLAREQQIVINEIQKLGFDPNQVRKKWIPADFH